MAKSLIRNQLGEKVYSIYLPCGNGEAQSFADGVLEGTYAVLELSETSGSDQVVEAEDVTVFYEEEETGKRGYLRLIVKSSKSEEDIINALVGKTYNGIKADKVVIISMRTVSF